MASYRNVLLTMVAALALATGAVAASSPLHPAVILRDTEGTPVLESGGDVSPLQTCGACHDTGFITQTSYHAWTGLGNYGLSPESPACRVIDPVTYSYPLVLAAPGLHGSRAWLRANADRHAGLDTSGVMDLQAGHTPGRHEAGSYEYNCFLCHIDDPDNAARLAALARDDFSGSALATLARTGIIVADVTGWTYDPAGFNPDGTVDAAVLGVRNPSSTNCGQCHGPVHTGDAPLVIDPDLLNVSLERTGEIYSAQRPADSGLNLAGKSSLVAPWDVHAERLLECADCHYTANSPAGVPAATSPGGPHHLEYDARRGSIGQYLAAPDHSLARGYGSVDSPGGFPMGNMRRCDGCHDAAATHDWLPFRARHLASLDCETCHIPQINAPSRMMTDWTLPLAPGTPQVAYRGIDGEPGDPLALIKGYTPVLLRRDLPDGSRRYGPANLQAAWFWVGGDSGQPVHLDQLNAAVFQDGAYHPALVTELDTDGDGDLTGAELRLVTATAVEAVAQRLMTTGVESPCIKGVLKPYGIHHGVVSGEHVLRECTACHGADSRLARTFALAEYQPGGVAPDSLATGWYTLSGAVAGDGEGGLAYRPVLLDAGVYLAGFHRWHLIDILGIALTLLVSAGIAGHALLRLRWSRRNGGGD